MFFKCCTLVQNIFGSQNIFFFFYDILQKGRGYIVIKIVFTMYIKRKNLIKFYIKENREKLSPCSSPPSVL